MIPKTRPADPATADLVTEVRSSVIPSATGEGGITAYVGGVTAANVDLASKISSQLVELILVVLALSTLLLLIAFRSLLIPVQAAITNLLCVGAAFGVLVATFQWGWGLDLVGLSTPYGTVPIASYVPLMMFAALFGLSMDYEVFLVSQIAQHHAAGEPPRQAVRSGVASSAKVIAAAAIIMISVFGSFVLNGDPTIKQFGVGLSVAVLLASAMVLSLAPAMLTLFGRRALVAPTLAGQPAPTRRHRRRRTPTPNHPPRNRRPPTSRTPDRRRRQVRRSELPWEGRRATGAWSRQRRWPVCARRLERHGLPRPPRGPRRSSAPWAGSRTPRCCPPPSCPSGCGPPGSRGRTSAMPCGPTAAWSRRSGRAAPCTSCPQDLPIWVGALSAAPRTCPRSRRTCG